MKLKQGLNIRKENEEFVFEFNESKIKKITSRMFPILLNKNNFNSQGYGILERAGFIEFEEIDIFYKVRGEIAEMLASNLIRDLYKAKHKVDVDLKTYEVSQFKGYDMFNIEYNWGNKHFGGVPDMVISKPTEHRTLFEVKSKNMKMYTLIAENGNIPEEEKLQAIHLGVLSKTPRVGMVYIFFTDKQETAIKKEIGKGNIKGIDVINEMGLTYRDIKPKVIYYDVDFENDFESMMLAKDILDSAIARGRIHSSKFKANEIQVLHEYLGLIETNHMEDLEIKENNNNNGGFL